MKFLSLVALLALTNPIEAGPGQPSMLAEQRLVPTEYLKDAVTSAIGTALGMFTTPDYTLDTDSVHLTPFPEDVPIPAVLFDSNTIFHNPQWDIRSETLVMLLYYTALSGSKDEITNGGCIIALALAEDTFREDYFNYRLGSASHVLMSIQTKSCHPSNVLTLGQMESGSLFEGAARFENLEFVEDLIRRQ